MYRNGENSLYELLHKKELYRLLMLRRHQSVDVQGSRMDELLRHLLLDQKVQSSIPGSNLLCSCHSGGLNSHMQAHKVYLHCLSRHLSDETLNRGPESIA